jgi:hypothetical protein
MPCFPVHGEGGFKKSFRDDKLVAEYAVIDPDLLATCPPGMLAANGMDALHPTPGVLRLHQGQSLYRRAGA